MILKTKLDTEKEEFFAFLWLLPLIPVLAIFLFFLCYGHFSWTLLLIAFCWFTIWGYVYRSIQTEICFDGVKVTLRLRRKTYIVSVADILYIEENSFPTNPLKTHEYKIYMQPNVNIPSAYLFVRNRKIQNNLRQLFPNIPVKQNIIL